MSENSEIKRYEEDKEYEKQLVDAGNAWRWAMVFNELCDDGSVAAIHMPKEMVNGKAKVECYIRCPDTQDDCPCSPSIFGYQDRKESHQILESQ